MTPKPCKRDRSSRAVPTPSQKQPPHRTGHLTRGALTRSRRFLLKRVHLSYTFLASLLLAISLSACGLQTPQGEDVPLTTQSAAPEMRVRSVSLGSDSRSWLSEIKGTTNYRSKTSTYSLEHLAGSGRVQDLSRPQLAADQRARRLESIGRPQSARKSLCGDAA